MKKTRKKRKERCVMCDTGRWPYEPWLMECPYCKGTQKVNKIQRPKKPYAKFVGKLSAGAMKTKIKKIGHSRNSNSSLIRKQVTKHRKKQKVAMLTALVDEWETLHGKDYDYAAHIRGLRAHLHAAKNQLKACSGV